MRWTGHAACMGRWKMHMKFQSKKPEGKTLLEV